MQVQDGSRLRRSNPKDLGPLPKPPNKKTSKTRPFGPLPLAFPPEATQVYSCGKETHFQRRTRTVGAGPLDGPRFLFLAHAPCSGTNQGGVIQMDGPRVLNMFECFLGCDAGTAGVKPELIFHIKM